MTDPHDDHLAEQFESHRDHLRAVAYRMLGSASEAEDAVQEGWLRLHRSDAEQIENLRGWLTTVVARVCLDRLRVRKARREQPLDETGAARLVERAQTDRPEEQAMLADSVGVALLIVLDTLTPPERLAFVLHDLFAVPHEEIAPIVNRSLVATRQLASRARRRVRNVEPVGDEDHTLRRKIVEAFLAAARGGDFEALLTVLDPEVVLRADPAAVAMAAAAGAVELHPEARGVEAVADTFAGGAQAAVPALVDGAVQLVWQHQGQPMVVFEFTIDRGRITGIKLVADQQRLQSMHIHRLRS